VANPHVRGSVLRIDIAEHETLMIEPAESGKMSRTDAPSDLDEMAEVLCGTDYDIFRYFLYVLAAALLSALVGGCSATGVAPFHLVREGLFSRQMELPASIWAAVGMIWGIFIGAGGHGILSWAGDARPDRQSLHNKEE